MADRDLHVRKRFAVLVSEIFGDTMRIPRGVVDCPRKVLVMGTIDELTVQPTTSNGNDKLFLDRHETHTFLHQTKDGNKTRSTFDGARDKT